MPVNNKSPIVRLKETLDALREENERTNIIIEQQTIEINKLRAMISNKTEDMVQSLSLEEPVHHSNVIHQLTIKLNQQEESYQRRLRSIQRRIKEKQEKLVELTSKADQLKLIYQRDLNELSSRHERELNKIRAQHENELKELKTKYQPAHTCHHGQLIDQIMEKVLIEFEQQEHSIIPQNIETQYHSTTHASSYKKYMPTTQSSYSKQYMPIDALSWPSPNARRLKIGI
ncbi:hypothetical protein BCV72DRAFT_309291 [Rhizopus microsporus var. microsporus]|uniref:Uncharacterized protein n=2 Tax=Rhizopus microsporus TaxID=58291 RepID=A0A2G4SX63_RHIZD|nr:uncharacterized protein RHIMIDRAFT_236443 [Rhizopus microsporus ATCC 52813]ORE02252.1 hypothetical protein BCV72DRAFT_309291 [Rhizopus microsporus var. microsporus]PHZ13373.1 hypothetical protein RHIMIDRAFT_236443 [Rhizopus microsporus ATCC 52813]